MSNPQSPEPSRWILEMFALDIPDWNRVFIELERKPLNALENMLVKSFDRYLRRKGQLTQRQIEVLRDIAKKHNVPLPPITPSPRQTQSSHTKRELNPWSALFQEIKNPIELEEAEVVKPEILARWRQWGISEDVISRVIQQRQRIRQVRQTEEWIAIPNFAYKMPRLPQVEAQPWGTAKAIDFEGTIAPRLARPLDRVDEGWRYIYHRPRVTIATRDYEPIEEIANMMQVYARVWRLYARLLKRHIIMYRADADGARAVRICHLIQPYLKIPEKKRRATEILTLYKQTPTLRIA